MFVEDVMHREVVTVAPRATVAEAFGLMRERGIRHLPVVDGGRLVGIVSDRDLKRAMPPAAAATPAPPLASLRVEELMTRKVITTAPAVSVEEAGRVMVSEKISALPVTESDRLVGMVTETDVVALLVRALGASEPSSRLQVDFAPGGSALADIVRTVEEAGVRIASIVTLATGPGSREGILRVASMDPRRAVSALEAKGYTVRRPAACANIRP
ncbi:MAG TPA: CBS domain-containing protein [Methylomirabilota bacterium]|nr:CBS domain-containing protein [Methylomirabilota bacterium]